MSVGAAAPSLAASGRYASLPRPFRFLLGMGVSPFWLAPAMALGYLGAAGFAGAFGDLAGADGFSSPWLVEITYALWFAWVPVAVSLLVRGTERDVRDLAPRLASDAGPLLLEALVVPRRAIWIGAGVGLAMTAGVAWIAFGVAGASLSPEALIFLLMRETLIEVAVFSVLGWGIGAGLRLSALVAARARPDLLDPHAFAPLARNGARQAALWLVVAAIGAPMLSWPSPSVDAAAFTAAIGATLLMAAVAAVVLVLPMRGARRVLREAKRTALSGVRREIAEARASREDTRLPGLIAWEKRVDEVSEWPLDLPSLLRVGLLLLLPIASWVCGALVERMVDAALG